MTSKSLVAFFITVQVLVGFDTGFFPVLSNRYKALASCISLVSIIVIFSLSIWAVILGPPTTLFHAMNYFLIVIIFKFVCSKYTLKNFCDDLLTIDKHWKTGISDYNFGILIGFLAFTMSFSRWMVTVTYAIVFGSDDVMVFLHIILPIGPVVAADLLPIINAVIFHNVYKRLNVLKIGLKSSRYDVKNAQVMYNDIAGCLEKVRMEHDYQIFLTFISDAVKLMFAIYSYLTFVLKNPNWTIQVIGGIYPIYHLIDIFLPALFAEMIAVQVDEMKMMLHDRLLLEQDVDEQQQLLRLLGLLEGRPLLRKAWRLVPVGLRRPILVLNFGVTYLIVIVQFTHLYE